MARAILHADMDAFYASIEQRDHPELRGRPVIVGGTGPRGVVSAASYEARQFGVRAAMPTVEARRLCPAGTFLPGRMTHYVGVSHEVQAIFEQFTPMVESLSLDEAFLDVSGSTRLLGSPSEIGRELKRRVRERTALAVSVGIAPSKMVAKIASALCKPDGLLEVRAEQVRGFLCGLSIEHLWGVGPVTQARLRAAGIHRIGQLAEADGARLRQLLGDHWRALWELASGQDERMVDSDRARRSYGEENTFARDVGDGEVVRNSIIAHAEAVAQRLRRDGTAGRTVTLKVKLADRISPGRFPLLTRRLTLSAPTDDGQLVADAALRLWRQLAVPRKIRLIGVAVSGLRASTGVQLGLFEGDPTNNAGKRAALNRALDEIVGRFGDTSISRGLARVPKAAPTVSIKESRTTRVRRARDNEARR